MNVTYVMFRAHKKLKLCFIVILVIVAGLLIGLKIKLNPLLAFDPSTVPPITANPMQQDKIFAVSLFRSGQGHDYSYGSWDGETCRSMKHYFNMGQNQVNNRPARSVPTGSETVIKIYAPLDGTITDNHAEQTPIGTQVRIASAKDNHFYIRLFHIDLLPSLKVGSNVQAGQLVGTIGPKDGMDVSYEANYRFGQTVYLSIFDYMTDEAFSPYQALGFKKSDFVLSRSQADANNYKCNGEQFVKTTNTTGNNNGDLEGYVSLRPNPYAPILHDQYKK